MILLTVLALLPPLWQDVAELKEILSNDQLGKVIQSGEAIESIDRTDTGWEIETNKGTYDIDVIAKPQNQPGPMQFELKFKKAPGD